MLEAQLSKLKTLFRQRKIAYCLTFKNNSPHARAVLEDLARFCRAHEATFTKDARMSDVLQGRREVWLRIQNYLNLNIEEIYDLHHVRGGNEQGQ